VLVGELKRLADERGITPAQLALAWLLAQGADVVPIPGTKRIERLEENAVAADIVLSTGDLERLEAAAPRGAWARDRVANGCGGGGREAAATAQRAGDAFEPHALAAAGAAGAVEGACSRRASRRRRASSAGCRSRTPLGCTAATLVHAVNRTASFFRFEYLVFPNQ
jgi:hypothetical protein